jgi:hypothetical protein
MFKNKWTTITGIVLLVGSAITAIAQLMQGDMDAIGALKEVWVGIAAGIVALKASDGSL